MMALFSMNLVYPDRHAALPYGVRERHGGRDEKCIVIRCPYMGAAARRDSRV